MLKTALTPRWIAGFVLATLVAGCFGFLARWQWSRSHEAPPPPAAITETVRPLSSVYKPGTALLQKQADHMVSVTGEFDESKQLLVPNRLQSGDKGYWTVAAFRVAGSDEWIPVVRGWSRDAAIPGGLPKGSVKLVARILPPEAPATDGMAKLGPGEVGAVSPSELTNRWDVSMYDAFLVPQDKVPATADASLERVVVGPQPENGGINWLNVFYAIEWVAFALFAYFVWFRLMRDDHQRRLEDAEDAEDAPRGAGGDGVPAGSETDRDADGGRQAQTSRPSETDSEGASR